MHRRDFLRTSVTSTAAFAALHSKAFAAATDTPLRVALIGCGWYGKTDLLHLLQVEPANVVALCDVDRRMLDAAAELMATRQTSKKQPAKYGDYRKLLTAEQPDVVLIATPDHWHCLPMVEACRASADVYVQKPISYDVVEGQAMVSAARKCKRTVQVGLQRRSTPHLLEARDKFIRTGALGTIAYVDIHSYYGASDRFPPNAPSPDYLDWEMYVGPAAWREYNPGIHPRAWRAAREFSNGQTGDLCVHFFDVIRYFLGLGWPHSVSAAGGRLVLDRANVNTHDTQTAVFDFDRLQVVWTQRNWGADPDPKFPWGAALYGDKGTLKLSVQSYDFIPHGGGQAVHADFVDERDRFPLDLEHKETELFAAPATRRHMQDFLAARREGRKPVCDIEEGHISTASCILANLSMELGRSLKWDAKAGRVVGDDEANRRLTRIYRDKWVHPTPENV